MENLNLVFGTELRKFELCSVTSTVFISVQLFLQQLIYSHIVTKGLVQPILLMMLCSEV